ncbi:MAG: rhomboid family intramembrane serine protease [Planctomycetaceae bacterium]|nr:MAG: rhomboid family intramembrane serine protease [Planctomycetaceae bacterium]
MRLIGHFEDEALTRRFGSVLYSRGIESHTDPVKDGRWQVWIIDDANLEAATSLLAQFRQSPADPVFEEAAKVAEQMRERAEKAQAPKRASVVDARTLFYSPPVPVGILSIALIFISVMAAVLTKLGDSKQFVQPLSISQYQEDGKYIYWDKSLPEVRHGQVWRLFTPMFLHFSILHLLFNMLWLRDLGSMIEARKGSWVLLLLVLILASTSNVAQYVYKDPAFGGMSGVVYGLLGYVWMQGRFNPASGLSLQPQTVTMMIVWFFVCLTGMAGPVANTVHAVGFGLGIGWGFLEAQLSVALRHR